MIPIRLKLELEKAMLREQKKKKDEEKERKNNSKERQQLTAGSFKIKQTLSGKKKNLLIVTGTALEEGTYHDLFYPSEEIRASASDLTGKPLRVMHKKPNIGEVLTAKYKNDKLQFKATITDSAVVKKVLNGTLDAVSTGVEVEITFEDGREVARDLDFVELSLTNEPACSACTVDTISTE